jgi:hypothetical protein
LGDRYQFVRFWIYPPSKELRAHLFVAGGLEVIERLKNRGLGGAAKLYALPFASFMIVWTAWLRAGARRCRPSVGLGGPPLT